MMWNGAFSPVLRKSIGTVKFVPLSAMTPRDWRWLDFDNTRTVAQNRIARMIMRGGLLGFFQVLITEKAAKNEYFWPADAAMVDDFANTNDPAFFGHEAEVLNEAQALDALEELRGRMVSMTPQLAAALVLLLIALADGQTQEELQNFGVEYFDGLTEDDMTLVVSALIMWELSYEEALLALEEFPESDEADDLRDWIIDRQQEIEDARAALEPIAAGRGL